MNKKFIILGIALIFLAALSVFRIFKSPLFQRQNKFYKFPVVSPQQKTIIQTIHSEGKIESEQQVSIRSKTNGVLQNILVKEGEFVSKNQVLAIIYNSKIHDNVLMRKNELQLAKLNYEEANQRLINGKKMFHLNSITRESYNRLKSEYQRSVFELQKAEKSLEYAIQEKNSLSVKAPINGKIIKIYESNGTGIVAGTKLFVIANMNSLVAKLFIDEHYLSQVFVSQNVILNSEGNQLISINSYIQMVSEQVGDENNEGLFIVKCPLKTQDRVKLGSTVQGEIIIKKKADILSIPVSAVWMEDNRFYVYLDKENKLEKISITIGTSDGENVEIHNLNQDDKAVLVENIEDLQEFRKHLK